MGYWSSRLQAALESSRNAPSSELREIYLRVAEHYRCLDKACSSATRIDLPSRVSNAR